MGNSSIKPSHRLQRVYNQMLRRCYNIDDLSYENYGATLKQAIEEWMEYQKEQEN